MLDLNVRNDEELKDVLNSLISALLPHGNYNPAGFSRILNHILNYINLEEFDMEYYALIKALFKLDQVNISNEDFIPKLTADVFSEMVSVSADSLISNPDVNIRQALEYEGMNSNIDIETTREAAAQLIYSRSMELYGLCYELAQPTDEVENLLPVYESAFLKHVGMQNLITQNKILTSSVKINRRVYSGDEDWLEYTRVSTNEIANRFRHAKTATGTLHLDSLMKLEELERQLNESFIPICNWGIPELDGDSIVAGTPILRHRLVVIAAGANVGKTVWCYDQAANIILSGHKVLYMYGEGEDYVVYSNILVNYIYKKYQIFVTTQMIADPEGQPDEVQKVIQIAKLELIESKLLSMTPAFSYDTVYTELENNYNELKFDVVIIDHSLALLGDIKQSKTNVDTLAIDCRNFKRNYPVCVIVCSHLSSAAKEFVNKGMRVPPEISCTRDSSSLDAEADDIYILRDNETLQKQGLIALENKKRRRAARLNEFVILRKMFDVAHYVYSEEDQVSNKKDELRMEEALSRMEEAYGDDSMFTL